MLILTPGRVIHVLLSINSAWISKQCTKQIPEKLTMSSISKAPSSTKEQSVSYDFIPSVLEIFVDFFS